jgi:hypothetical protein
MELLLMTLVGFDIRGQRSSTRPVFTDFMNEYDSISREVLENIPIKFGIPIKLIRPNKIYLNYTYNKVRRDKCLFEKFILFRMI